MGRSPDAVSLVTETGRIDLVCADAKEWRGGGVTVSTRAGHERCVPTRLTFIINQQGKVHQKDLGPNTASLVRKMNAYDPDASWAVSPD